MLAPRSIKFINAVCTLHMSQIDTFICISINISREQSEIWKTCKRLVYIIFQEFFQMIQFVRNLILNFYFRDKRLLSGFKNKFHVEYFKCCKQNVNQLQRLTIQYHCSICSHKILISTVYIQVLQSELSL